jgi:adenylosuccinate synthase
MPMTQTEFHHAEPVYEELPGWVEDISGCRSFEELPGTARDYVRRLEELSGAPVSAVGVGARRDQTVVLRDLVA